MKLDTRSKILSPAESGRFPGAVFVAMHLDPLTAAHARRVAEIAAGGRPVVVLLDDPPAPLLPLAARAELAASLASVAAVIPLPDGTAAPVRAEIDERAADLERREALMQHVSRRHATASSSRG